ncbi:DUF370 domain-containing protein [Caldicellulosiruptor changbaiensis]|uniref:DUF370 domain-containing protein n=1 Tax=Caldicellulosiruptor changbaiensis TaxID=1222016 RepID=A0A3T0D1V3_9FIRM|nr:extracellular matrix/biofilm biosynthesis regulator RemA family protein [Caldicellulosiruptor changbaiensis]AZT89202.1 DUF370 domain-containing protein [Caldicellulosiruptor changbaiensis]
MFAHIGEDYVVNSSELLLIMNYDIFMSSEDNLRILESLKNEDRLVVINDDLKKSIIILEIDGRLYAIVSPVSSTTIAKRFLNFNYYVDNYLDES